MYQIHSCHQPWSEWSLHSCCQVVPSKGRTSGSTMINIDSPKVVPSVLVSADLSTKDSPLWCWNHLKSGWTFKRLDQPWGFQLPACWLPLSARTSAPENGSKWLKDIKIHTVLNRTSSSLPTLSSYASAGIALNHFQIKVACVWRASNQCLEMIGDYKTNNITSITSRGSRFLPVGVRSMELAEHFLAVLAASLPSLVASAWHSKNGPRLRWLESTPATHSVSFEALPGQIHQILFCALCFL